MSVRSNGRSAVATPPKINPIAAPTIQNAVRFGTMIIANRRMTHDTIVKTKLRFGPILSTSRPIA